MAEKRKDNKGRVLKTREVQRKDGTYQWTYDDFGKRRYIYAPTLNELRKKKAELQSKLDRGIDYSAFSVTVRQLVEKYIDLCSNRTRKTVKNYGYWLKMAGDDVFLTRRISDVKPSDCKLWLKKINENGKSFGTTSAIHRLFHAAFNVACQDDILLKNPFNFKINEVIKNNTKEREILTEKELLNWMTFLCNDKTYCKWYPIFALLLSLGLRVSELCGLTISDLDFENGYVNINKQLLKAEHGEYYVNTPKTQKSVRKAPMDEVSRKLLTHLLAVRKTPDEEFVVDGYSGFLLLATTGRPMVEAHIYTAMSRAEQKYNKLHPDAPIKHTFPHLYRHMYCSDMLASGLTLKEVAAAMGHSGVGMELRVYGHVDEEKLRDKLANAMSANNKRWPTPAVPLQAVQ